MARNETRVARWGRWMLTATAIGVAVQIASRVLLDQPSAWIIGTATWYLLLAGLAVTAPVKARSPRSSRASWKIVVPTMAPALASLFAPTWPDTWPDIALLWFGLAALSFFIVFGAVLWWRLRRARAAPDRLVDLRAQHAE